MDEKSASSVSRPVSPSLLSKNAPRQQRRSSSSNAVGAAELIKAIRSNSPNQHRGGRPNSNSVPLHEEAALPRTPTRPIVGQHGGTTSSKRRPRPHAQDVGDDSEIIERDLNITLHDILQSRWIEDLNNHAAEQIYLTVEHAPLSQMSTIDTDFCWVHHKRDPEQMHFEDFVRIVNNTPLYQHEYDVALKALSEVERMRYVFAKGKYFEPLVHQVTDSTETIAGKKAEVKATFISMPVFSSMQSKEAHPHHKAHDHFNMLRKPLQKLYETVHNLVHEEEYSRDHHKDLATKELRKREVHPIRSLMQFKNILAVDHTRDWQQAMIRLGDRKDQHQPFIHVPEIWVLIVNMYTIITCAPFSVEHLEGENIKQRSPEKADMRVNVKYTSLHGALHEFRCRTWLGLLNTITSIEHHIDSEEELSEQLGSERSLYKLVDTNFRLIDRKRWIWLTSFGRATSKASVRLLKLASDDVLNVTYSTRKSAVSRRLAWERMRYQVVWENLRQKLREMHRKSAPIKEVRSVEERLATVRLKMYFTRTERIRQRFLYAAVRYHLIDPRGLLFHEDQTYLDAIRERVHILRSESTLSAPGKESGRPPAEGRTSALGSQLHSRDASPVSRTKIWDEGTRKTNPQHEKRLESPNLKVPSAYSVGLEQRITKCFERPPKRMPVDLEELEGLSILPSPLNAVETGVFSGRFPRPKKALTSASLIASRGEDQRLRTPARALTSATVDVEAQILRRRTKPQVTLTSASSEMVRAPTFVIREQEHHLVQRGSLKFIPITRASLSEEVVMPYMLRPLPQFRRMRPKSMVIAPERLPRLSGDVKFSTSHADRSEVHNGHEKLAHLKIPEAQASEPLQYHSRGNFTSSASLDATEGPVQARIMTARRKKDLRRLQPFFKWKTAGAVSPVTPRDSHQTHSFASRGNFESSRFNRETESTDNDEAAANSARHTLAILYDQMTTGYFVSEAFRVQPRDLTDVLEMSLHEVTALLDRQLAEIKNDIKDPRCAEFKWQTRVDIALSVDSILRCFIGNDNQDHPLVRKVWGLVGGIASIPLEELKAIDAHCDDLSPSVLTWLKRELAQVEQTCLEVLLSARSDTGNKDEQLNIPLPQPFLAQFRDIILFLLTVNLLRQDPEYYHDTVKEMSNTVEEGWAECETALVRSAREFKEHGDNQEYLHESIKTADRLLGLLLFNAFALSCSPVNEDDLSLPYCDLEHIYRRWTAICHERAIREASAEMYEEVRLLREELQIVIKLLGEQRLVLEKITQARESPQQRLDMRVNKRTETFLDDMINHFETLEAYAKEAETLTTNSIRVRSEGNSKAIFIFTFVTVIFLPLNSISSILGMNTVDIRGTTRTSRFFWEISVPVMFFVLLICLLLVKFRFRFGLRRKIGRCVLLFFPRSWESEHMRIKRQGRQMPRQVDQSLQSL